MTTFGDMVFQLGGSPVGGLPIMTGENKYYFVDGKYGLDGNSGSKPTDALATIGAAITLARARVDWSATPWARRDVIVIAPGSYDEALNLVMAHAVSQ